MSTTPGRRVPNGPLRVKLERSGSMNPSQIAAILGWKQRSRGREYPDGGRVRVELGMRSTIDVRGRRTTRRTLDESVALAIGELLGLDPREIGL